MLNSATVHCAYFLQKAQKVKKNLQFQAFSSKFSSLSEPFQADHVAGRMTRSENRKNGLARPILTEIEPYIPGKPISEVMREFGVKDVVKLASNENPLGPSPRAVEAMREAIGQAQLYPDGNAYQLRQKLALRHDLPMEGILLGNGSVELMEIICEAYLEPGREAITGPQAFFKYRIACQIMGVRPIMVPMPGFQYDVQGIIRAMTPKTKLVFIANPNNPTGWYLDRQAVERILGALPSSALLVLDEAYYDYVHEPDYPNGLDYVKAGAPVIVTRSFSKIYGLAGVRCGYALTLTDIAADLQKVREVFNCNSLAQVSALASLDDANFLKKSIESNRAGLMHLEEGLKKLGLKANPSVCNFVLVDFGKPIGPIFRELLKRGVIIRPMEPYELPTCARISVGLPRQHEKLFEALREII
jgi:histidinol-phosphate aminotransferase